MKAKLKVIKNWEFEEFELTGTSFKYSPTGCKGMVARSEDEDVYKRQVFPPTRMTMMTRMRNPPRKQNPARRKCCNTHGIRSAM